MVITMAHGSGGIMSAELFKSVFAPHFSNSILNKMEDAAVFDLSGRLAFSTDSYVVTPLVFSGGDIGKLSVCGTVNDLLMAGAEPRYISCGFILEEGLEITLLEKIVRSMADTARSAGVDIVAGDTKVIAGNGGLYINTSGIGLIPPGRDVGAANIREGDKVILSGGLGSHHASILSARMEIENGIISDCACLGDVTKALFDSGIAVRSMRDVTRGGLATILNELAQASGCGIELSEHDIPLSDEVMAFCGILGLDPLYMGNEGRMAIAVPPSEADKAVSLMRETENGKNAAIIGKAVNGSGVTLKTKIGGSRLLDSLYGEGLPRIC